MAGGMYTTLPLIFSRRAALGVSVVPVTGLLSVPPTGLSSIWVPDGVDVFAPATAGGLEPPTPGRGLLIG